MKRERELVKLEGERVKLHMLDFVCPLLSLRIRPQNRSVLFPSALATIAEESTRRGKRLYFSCPRFCD